MISILLLLILSLAQQTPPAGSSLSAPEKMILHGTVKDPNGAVIHARVHITVLGGENSSTNGEQFGEQRPVVLETDPYGQYSVELSVAPYKICVIEQQFTTSL